jgi:hypothetical protein
MARVFAVMVQGFIEARKLSRYIGFILRVMARVRVYILAGFVLGAGFCKNRDKQLTHIVRVISRVLFLFFDVRCTRQLAGRFFRQLVVSVLGGYGMRFCSPGTRFISYMCVAVQSN